MKSLTSTQVSSKSKKKIKAGIPARLALSSGPLFVGVDAHKNSFRVSVVDLDARKIVDWSQISSSKTLIDHLAPVADRIQRIFYEAGPTGYVLCRDMRNRGFACDVIAPSLIPSLSGPQPKTDKLDALRLAVLGSKGLLQPIAVPTIQEEAERDVLRLREQVKKDQKVVKNRIAMYLLKHGIPDPRKSSHWSIAAVDKLKQLARSSHYHSDIRFCVGELAEQLEYLTQKLKQVEKHLKSVMERSYRKEKSEQLRTIPGIGWLTAATFLLELIQPKRFNNHRQIARYLGLAPQTFETGETRRGGHILRSGNRRLRHILVEATWRFTSLDPEAHKKFLKIAHNTGNKKKAIVAMARKLGILLWKITVTGESYKNGSEQARQTG